MWEYMMPMRRYGGSGYPCPGRTQVWENTPFRIPLVMGSSNHGPIHGCPFNPVVIPCRRMAARNCCARKNCTSEEKLKKDSPAEKGDMDEFNPFFEILDLMFGPDGSEENKEKTHKTTDEKVIKWQKKLDLSGFNHENVTVTVADDNVIFVKAQREVKDKNGGDCEYVQLTRELKVPQDVNLKTLQVFFTDNGMVTLIANREVKDTEDQGREVSMKVEETGAGEQNEKMPKDASAAEMTEARAKEDMNQEPLSEADQKTLDHQPDSKRGIDGDEKPEVDPSQQKEEDKTKEQTLEDAEAKGSNTEQETTVATSQPEFSLTLDLKDFPEEAVEVKADGNRLVVKACHEEKADHYTFTREYHRSVDLPEGVDASRVKSKVNEKGELVISTS